jgi:hypothetical protein
MLEPERIFSDYRISLNLGIVNWSFSVFSELYIFTLKAVCFLSPVANSADSSNQGWK